MISVSNEAICGGWESWRSTALVPSPPGCYCVARKIKQGRARVTCLCWASAGTSLRLGARCGTVGTLGLTVGGPWSAGTGWGSSWARAGASAGGKRGRVLTFFSFCPRSRCRAMAQSKIMAVSRSALGAGAGLCFWVDDQLWIDMMS